MCVAVSSSVCVQEPDLQSGSDVGGWLQLPVRVHRRRQGAVLLHRQVSTSFVVCHVTFMLRRARSVQGEWGGQTTKDRDSLVSLVKVFCLGRDFHACGLNYFCLPHRCPAYYFLPPSCYYKDNPSNPCCKFVSCEGTPPPSTTSTMPPVSVPVVVKPGTAFTFFSAES